MQINLTSKMNLNFKNHFEISITNKQKKKNRMRKRKRKTQFICTCVTLIGDRDIKDTRKKKKGHRTQENLKQNKAERNDAEP